MPLSYQLPEDKIIWAGNRRGEFTVKSAYFIALKVIETNEDGECSGGDVRAPLWKSMWHLKIPSKIRIFVWRACMNALPTKLNLCRRGVKTDVWCPMCGQEAESIAHALLFCDYAKQVWNNWEDCPVGLDEEHLDFSEAALRILNEGAVRDLEIFAVAAWSIWYNRNQKCFEDKPHPHKQVWHLAKRLISEQKEANASLNGNLVSEGLRWLPPPPEFHKINVDGASSDDGRRSSIGAVIRNCKGETVAALCKMLPGQYSSLETEFLAIQEGVLLARELELSQIIIESDSLIAIQCLNALNTDGGWGHLCQGILNLMDVFRSWNFKHLKRDYNKVAHDLAQHSRCYGISQVWKGAIPPMVQHLIHLESITASQLI